jgi:hypothetical protein
MRRYQLFALLGGMAAICAAWMIAATSALCQDSGKPAKLDNDVAHCRSIKDERARIRCYEEKNSGVPTSLSQQQPIEPGTWQLARTPNPAGGPDSISITKIADATRSDPDVAGLMLRCGEGATTEVLVVLIEPLPSRTHPKVTVVAGAMTTEFTASVVTPGALVLLPEKASALVEGAWQSIPELAVAIAANHRSLHGVIPLADIRTAMQTLQSNCLKAAHGR